MQESSDLQEALRKYLTRNGALGRAKLALRSEIFAALKGPEDVKIRKSTQQQIMDELVREYLELVGYENCAEIFREEAELEQGINRDLIEAHLKVESIKDCPLLWSLVFNQIRCIY